MNQVFADMMLRQRPVSCHVKVVVVFGRFAMAELKAFFTSSAYPLLEKVSPLSGLVYLLCPDPIAAIRRFSFCRALLRSSQVLHRASLSARGGDSLSLLMAYSLGCFVAAVNIIGVELADLPHQSSGPNQSLR